MEKVPQSLEIDKARSKRPKLNGLESSHRHWLGRRSKAFWGLWAFSAPIGWFKCSLKQPLVMTKVVPYKEGEFFISVRPEGETVWSKWGLWSWFAGSCAHIHYSFITQQNLWSRGRTLLNLGFNIVGIILTLREACFYVSFPALFFSPLSRSLQPQGSQLAALSGCSEGSSNCALNPCLLTSQVTHTLTSLPLFCCSQTRAPGGKMINQSAIHYTVHHLPTTLTATCQLYVIIVQRRTHKQKWVQ